MLITNNFIQYFPQLNNGNLPKNLPSRHQFGETAKMEISRLKMQTRQCSEENYNLVDRSEEKIENIKKNFYLSW